MVRRTPASRPKQEHAGSVWIIEVWRGFRPYLVRLAIDFCIFVAIWLVLLGAHVLTTGLPLGTRLSGFLAGFHEAVVVATFVWLSLQATWDIVILRRKKSAMSTITDRALSLDLTAKDKIRFVATVLPILGLLGGVLRVRGSFESAAGLTLVRY